MRQMILRMLGAFRNAALAARRGSLVASDKNKTREEPPSAHPVAALVPTATLTSSEKHRRAWAADELRPSMQRLSKRVRMRLTKYAIVACLCTALLCALAVPALSSVKVRHIRVEGAVHHTQDGIALLSGVKIGDELFLHHAEDIEARLKEQCPYLLDVRVRREGAGLSILLTESTPRWALVLSDGRVALVDADGYICEVCTKEQAPKDLCTLYMPLPMLPSEEDEEVLQPQTAVAGKYIEGSSSALTLLDRLSSALPAVALPAAPASLDLSDIYSVALTLDDGTQILLHECSDPARQLSRAALAIDSYMATHPDASATQVLIVDVDEAFRVSIRSVPKPAQETQDKTEES